MDASGDPVTGNSFGVGPSPLSAAVPGAAQEADGAYRMALTAALSGQVPQAVQPRRGILGAAQRAWGAVRRSISGSYSMDGTYGRVGTDSSTISFLAQLRGSETIDRPFWQDPWIWATTARIAEAASDARLVFYQDQDDPESDEVPRESPIYGFFRRPHPQLSYKRWMRHQIIQWWLFGDEVHVLRFGDQTAWATDPRRIPADLGLSETRAEKRLQLWPIKADCIELMFATDEGRATHWRFEDRWRGDVTIPLEAAAHIYSPDPYDPMFKRGLGRLQAALRTCDIDWQAERYTEAEMRTAGVPNVQLVSKMRLSDEQRRALRDEYKRRHAAPEAHGEPMVYWGKELEVLFPGHTPRDMEWMNVRTWNRDTKIAVMGGNKAFLGMTDDDTRANAQEGRRNAWEDTILPSLRIRASEIQNEILPKLPEPYSTYGVGFDVSHIEALKEDEGARWERAKMIFDTFPVTMRQATQLVDIDLPDEFEGADERKPEPLAPLGGPGMPGDNRPQRPQPQPPSSKAIDILEFEMFRTTAARLFADTTSFHEKQLEKASRRVMEQFLHKARRMAEDMAAEAANRTVRRDLSPDQFEALLPDGDSWTEMLLGRLTPIEERMFLHQAQLLADALGASRILELADPAAVEFLASKEIKLKEVIPALREAVKRALEKALIEEGGVGSLADQIRNALEMYRADLKVMQDGLGARAERIARTESTAVANGARMAEAEAQGVTEMRWISARDNNVRESHASLDGQVRPLGQEFGYGLRHPGDPNAPAGQVINCRCSLAPTARGVGRERSLALSDFYRAEHARQTEQVA